jgi:prophage regulatory protein
MVLLAYKDLKAKGIKWSRQHVDRLVKAGLFPPPFYLGANTKTWTEKEIDQYITDRIAQRDAA